MAARTPARIEPTDDWPYLQLQFAWPGQEAYEAVRPVVLFGFTPAERAQQTGLSASTIYRKAQRFDLPLRSHVGVKDHVARTARQHSERGPIPHIDTGHAVWGPIPAAATERTMR